MNRHSLVSRLRQAGVLSCTLSLLAGSMLVAQAEPTKSPDAQSSSAVKTGDLPSAGQVTAQGTAASATTAVPAQAAAASAAVQAAASPSAVIAPTTEPSSKVLLKPGQPLSLNMAAEDLVPTDNVELARQQALAYPDSAEASFILAVAMSRTSRVEDALKEVRRARRLAEAAGGAVYFDKMIASYEEMLKSYPDDNRVRYGLAWAYYMKAYLLAKKNPANPNVPAVSENSPASPQVALKQNWVNNAQAGQVLGMLSPQLANKVATAPGALPAAQLPHIKGALELASPSVVPQVKQYYESALKNLDDLLVRTPDDIWARVYRAHLAAEFTGNLEDSMNVWRTCQKQAPQNPAPYFFLGEGYLKQGNLKECLNNISRAIALRAVGN